MKKIISSILVLICAGAVFYFGWVQIKVPVGSYGVMLSKTSGVFEKPIVNGRFAWKWQPLLPTNAQIRLFSAAPQTFTADIKGKLPSSEIYSDVLAGKPDFSYEFSLSLLIAIIPEQLPALIKKIDLFDQTSLQNYLQTQANLITTDIEQFFVSAYLQKSPENLLSYSGDLVDKIDLREKYASVNIHSAIVQIQKMPDTALYTTAKAAYEIFQEKTKNTIEAMVLEQAHLSAQDFFKLARYSQWGKILNEYPVLIDFLAVSREDAAEVLKNLNAARNVTE